MTWDETGGWIFSDEAHDLMDQPRPGLNYRPGVLKSIEEIGWYVGLYSIKEESNDINTSAAARFPLPFRSQDLG